MHIKFAHKEISEYATGNLAWKNDGKAFEVDAALGRELLWQKAFLGGEMVNVFEPAAAGKPKSVESVESIESIESSYPEGFPSADVLAAAGFTHEEALLLTYEQLTDIKGIGPKSADAIIEFHKGD